MHYSFEPDYLFKIIIVGNSGTGKSSLLMRLCHDIFSEDYISTIGIDFKTKTFEIDNYSVKLQIWDTAGQERFKSIITSYYRGIHGIIVVFDLSDIKSFENINNWMTDRDNYCNSNICTIIIGTKADIKKKDIITDDMISDMCINHGASYIETSSKNNFNVNDAFELISKKLIEKNNSIYIKHNNFKLNDNISNKNNCCVIS